MLLESLAENHLVISIRPEVANKLRATYVAHTNSSKFMLRDEVWNEPDVEDVTAEIQAAMP